MNPAMMMQLMQAKNTFDSNHPKFGAFLKAIFGSGIPAGTVIEITVQKPGESPVTSNIKVQESDLELLESLKNMGR